MEQRYTMQLHPKSWAKIASPWYAYKEVDEADAKECSVCWENCTSFLHCSNSEEHIICKSCSKEIVENQAYVNPDASIEVKWKCPLCRCDNELGNWQFLPSVEQTKTKQVLQENRRDRLREDIMQNMQRSREQRDAEFTQEQARERIQEQARLEARAHRQALLERVRERERQRLSERLSEIDENAPSKFRWIVSLNWKNSLVNHFKAWIMYTDPSYLENIHDVAPSGARLRELKEEHNYEELKKQPNAPWHKFLWRKNPEDPNSV